MLNFIADLILEDIEDLEGAVFSEEEEQLNRYCVQDFYEYYYIHLINAFLGQSSSELNCTVHGAHTYSFE